MKRKWWVVAALVSLVLAGCAKPSEEVAPPSAMPSSGASAAPPVPMSVPASPGEGAKSADKAASSTSDQAKPIERKIIYEGYVTIETDQVGTALAALTKLARDMGGYEGNMEQTAGGMQRATVTLRVPADRFGAFMAQAAKLGRVMSQKVEAKDVGEEWVDLEARLRTKRQEEERLLELLRRVGAVNDLLEVEKELSRVRGEIEQAQGRLRYLGNQVALSTVHVDLQAPAGVAPVQGWRASSVAKSAAQDLLAIGRGLSSLLIYLAVMAPVWGSAALLWLLWRRRRRRDDPSL